jgi:hypothetical protein
MLIPPAYRDCVCFVYATFRGESKPVGTAFFLCISKPPVRWIVVVTALHVVANAQRDSDDGKTFLRVNTKDGGYRHVEVVADKWFKPDMSEEIIDIAFCQWETLPGSSDFDFLCVGSELAATSEVIEAEEIGVGNEIAFAGLFVRHHGKRRNEPIVRFGNICAMPAEPVSTAVGDVEAYLVESRSVGGLSGSPVFVDVGLVRNVGNVRSYRDSDGPALYLLGVVNAHWNAPAGSPAVEGDLSTEMVNMGIAVVTPIDRVLDVIRRSSYGRAMDALTEKAMRTPWSAVDEQGRVHIEVRLDEPDETAERPAPGL